MPSCQFWLEQWAQIAKLEPGQPIFRAIDRKRRISERRLGNGSVSTIIKARVRAYARLRGKTKVEADELVKAFSGHSMQRLRDECC